MASIYKIWNELNDNVYIGQTIRPLSARWKEHTQRYKYIENHLYLAMRKYGIQYFHIELIEECLEKDLDEREKYWIAYYNSYYDGYNETIGGQGIPKYEIEEEDIERLWKEGKTISQIADELQVTRTAIKNRIYDKPYYNEEESQLRGRKVLAKTKEKPIIQLTLDGKEINRFNSGVEAQEKTGIDRKAISQALRTGGNSHGYKWKYVNQEDNKRKVIGIIQLDKEDNILKIYSSVKKASEETGISKSSIYSVCTGRQKTGGGYKWKYKYE